MFYKKTKKLKISFFTNTIFFIVCEHQEETNKNIICSRILRCILCLKLLRQTNIQTQKALWYIVQCDSVWNLTSFSLFLYLSHSHLSSSQHLVSFSLFLFFVVVVVVDEFSSIFCKA